MAYIERDLLKQHLNIEGDDKNDIIDQYLKAAINYVENYTGRSFTGALIDATHTSKISADTIRFFKGAGVRVYLNYDISKITEVKIADEAELDTATPIDLSKVEVVSYYFGIVEINTPVEAGQSVQIKYTYGNTTTPDLINQAILARAMINADQSNDIDFRRPSNINLGDLQVSFNVNELTMATDKILKDFKYISV